MNKTTKTIALFSVLSLMTKVEVLNYNARKTNAEKQKNI